jgi:CheY-like chemotaxis protein
MHPLIWFIELGACLVQFDLNCAIVSTEHFRFSEEIWLTLSFLPAKAVLTTGGKMRWPTAGIVLIVDREDDVLNILRTALQSTDYVFLHATTGDEALSVLSRLKHPIDLTIVDLELPRDDGLVISLLTILGSDKTTKVIVKTSRQDQPFLESVKYFGIDAIVLKPISEEQLIRTVQKTLSGRPIGSARASAGTAS